MATPTSGGIFAATPYGAAAQAAIAIAQTPNTSATGATTSGNKGFNNTIGGLNFGTQGLAIPSWAWIVAAVVGGVILLRMTKRN